jgi:hypothetical protein
VRVSTGFQLRGFDFVFFEFLTRHPKLQIENAVGFMEFFSGVIFKDFGFSKIAIDIYLQLITRFKGDLDVERQLLDFTQ